MLTAQEIENGLAQCYGTQEWTRWSPLFRNIVLTDGAKFLAESADCYWFMDIIGSYQPEFKNDEMLQDFQIWTLKVDTEAHTGVVTCERDTDDVVVTQVLEFTDFPLKEIKLYCNSGGPQGTRVILLPSEY